MYHTYMYIMKKAHTRDLHVVDSMHKGFPGVKVVMTNYSTVIAERYMYPRL